MGEEKEENNEKKCLCETIKEAGRMILHGWRWCAYCGKPLLKGMQK